MTYQEVLAAAKEATAPNCMACPVCNGKACGNKMPGPGCKYPGNTAARNYEKWQEICVNMDTLNPNADIDISFDAFGHSFKAPVFVAPLGAIDMHYGPKYTDVTYNKVLIKSACEYGILAMTGDGVNPEVMINAVQDSQEFGGLSIPTIKPWNKEAVFEKIDFIHKHNVIAAAMDVDGAGLPFLKAMNPNAGSKSVAELSEIIKYADMPFMVKGIMTVKGAEKAVEAGAAAIVVSNHGGRVQGGVPSTCEVLPEIADAVKGKIKIFVDGGIRSGVDVFRAIALGADAVLIGRPVLTAIYGGGQEGFNIYMDKIIGELKGTMQMCGTPSLKDITREAVRF